MLNVIKKNKENLKVYLRNSLGDFTAMKIPGFTDLLYHCCDIRAKNYRREHAEKMRSAKTFNNSTSIKRVQHSGNNVEVTLSMSPEEYKAYWTKPINKL